MLPFPGIGRTGKVEYVDIVSEIKLVDKSDCGDGECVANHARHVYVPRLISSDKNASVKYFTCGLYYKTITIVIMTIVSDATIWSVTCDRN